MLQSIPQNRRAFLDTVAFAEIGPALMKISDNGYNVCVGSTLSNPILFDDYTAHPRIRSEKMNSDAAGRYQFMGRYWIHYRNLLKLPDFGPESQDRWALALIGECRALADIDAGRLNAAVAKCASRWASFPGNAYGQPVKPIADLARAFIAAGGVIGP